MRKMLITGIAAAMLAAPIVSASVPASTAHAAAAVSTSSYKEAVKQGDILAKVLAAYQKAISSGDIEAISNKYDGFTKQVSIVEKSIGKVYGASKRAALLAKYITPAKVEKSRTMYEVSQFRFLNKILDRLYAEEEYETYDSDMAKFERLAVRTAEVKKAGGFKPLPASVTADLRMGEAIAAGVNLSIYEYTVQYSIDSEADLYTADAFYDDMNRYLKQTEIKIGHVSGRTNRTELLKEFVSPAKSTSQRIKYEIEQLRLLDTVYDLAEAGLKEEANAEFSKLEGLKVKAAEIKKAGGFKALPKGVYTELVAYEKELKDILAEF